MMKRWLVLVALGTAATYALWLLFAPTPGDDAPAVAGGTSVSASTTVSAAAADRADATSSSTISERPSAKTRSVTGSPATTLAELSLDTAPTPSTVHETTEVSPTTTTSVPVVGVAPPVVLSLDWPGGAIPAKVLMVGYKQGVFLGFAVADLAERTLKVYPNGHHYFDGISTDGGTITSRGDVLIEDRRRVYLVPGGDFSKPFVSLQPSRSGRIPSGIAHHISGAVDRSGSFVWMVQRVYGDRPDDPRLVVETLVDLVRIDTRETVMSSDFEGGYRLVGILDDGIVLREYKTRLVKVLRPDGTRHPVTPNLGPPSEGWREGFEIVQAYGHHIALLQAGNKKMIVVDARTGDTHPVPKPGAGIWTSNGLPRIPTSSTAWTHSDEFVIGFRMHTGEWSLHEVRLSDQSVNQLGEYPSGPLPSRISWYKPLFAAESVAHGQAALAFTGWPVSPDNDATINLIDPDGSLIPVSDLPDDYFIIDAA